MVKAIKGTFKRLVYSEQREMVWQETAGYMVGSFGVWQAPHGWSVTHLATGNVVSILERKTRAAIVEAIGTIEAAGFDWSLSDMHQIAASGGKNARELYDFVKAA